MIIVINDCVININNISHNLTYTGMATPSNPGSSESAKMIGSSFSLVRYNNPVLIDKHPTPTHSPTESSNSEKSKTETEELLDSILPPREWEEEGQLWRQSVSSTPATRLDVINLQEQLDQKLQQRQARETGICQVRRELYAQCFDELIRQCTINCMERGLLLLRVRDELRMTLHAYQTLYESSIAFGIRKALQAEQGKADMESNISILEDEKMELERKVADLKHNCEIIEKRAAEQKLADEKNHAEEINFLKRTNQQLKAQLEGIISQKK
uniref:33 kDa inner dynein arm light chain, axonemallike [Aplysia californica] n=1 Tax=Lepeophtheirus salmonis TaxID=72036 RepID=A0A0K2UIX9_LEPSM